MWNELKRRYVNTEMLFWLAGAVISQEVLLTIFLRSLQRNASGTPCVLDVLYVTELCVSTDDDYSSCMQSENDEMRQRSNDNSEIQFEGRNISVAEYLYDSVFGSAVVNI